MPEAYTHIRIARAALSAARLRVPCENVYEAGAQGPDPLLAAHALRGRASDLPALARRMHTQDCGAFLALLLQNAQTPAQRSYALGFLMHYAADTVLHPYVLSQCAPGQPFEKAFGHGFFETALDSFFCQADNGKAAVPFADAAPALHTRQLAEVCALLKKTVRSVYGQDVPVLDFADAFHLFRLGHKHSHKRLLARTADVLLRKKGCLLSHTTPQKPPKNGFSKTWTHPETGEAQTTGPHALCMQAVHKGAEYLAVAGQLWQGKLTPAQCWHKLGSNSYFTGLPCKKEPVSAQTSEIAVTQGANVGAGATATGAAVEAVAAAAGMDVAAAETAAGNDTQVAEIADLGNVTAVQKPKRKPARKLNIFSRKARREATDSTPVEDAVQDTPEQAGLHGAEAYRDAGTSSSQNAIDKAACTPNATSDAE